MKHLRLPAVVAALAAVTVAAAAAAAAAPQAAKPPLQLLSVQQKFVLLGPGGPDAPPTLGDRMIFDDVLYNHVAQLGRPAGARVGRAEGVCTISAPRSVQCLVTAHLPNGEVVVVLAFPMHDGPSTSTAAIVGGAGAYSAARGTVFSRDLSQTKSIIVIHLAA